MQRQVEWSEAKSVLCIRPDNMGDVLMTTPAIRALKESVDGRRITLLTSSAGRDITAYIPCIDEVIAFDLPWQGDHDTGKNDVNALIALLGEKKFDAAVIFNVYSQNPLPAAMICWMAGIPLVAGYCRENPYRLLTHWLPDKEPLYEIKHEVERQLDLVKMIGADVKNDKLSLDVPVSAADALPAKLRAAGVDIEKPWLVVHAGVSETRRQYPAELFAEVIERVVEELGYQVLLTGLEAERDLVEYIRDITAHEDRVFSLAGMIGLDEMIALISAAPLLVSNNTGPVHIAAATGTPVLVLYALTNPQHAPWKVKHKILPFDVPEELRSKNVIVSYAYEKAFTDPPAIVEPGEILNAIKEMLSGAPALVKTEVVRL